MFREMRRKNQLLSDEETIGMLRSGTSGVLAVAGDNGYPYAVPLSYAYEDGKLYFHFARAGHKLDSLLKDDRVSFCVIKADDVVEEAFTTHYSSVIVFGRARILTEEGEKKHAMECLVEKYSPRFIPQGQLEIEREWNNFCTAEIQIEHVTGKAAIEEINNKK